MDDQKNDQEGGQSESPFGRPRITSTPRERILAGVLALIYFAGLALVEYAEPIENRLPARVFWVGYATWFAIMLVLPLAVVCLFFGIDRSPAWLRGRFSLRALLIIMTLVAIVLGTIVWAVEVFNPTTF